MKVLSDFLPACLGIVILVCSLNVGFAQKAEYDKAFATLVKEIRPVATPKGSVTQQIEQANGFEAEFLMESQNKKGEVSTESFMFHFGDVNPESVRHFVSAKSMFVELTIHNEEKYIQHFKNSNIFGYTDSYKFPVEDIDHARAIVDALVATAQAANQAQEDNRSNFSDLDKVVQGLSANLSYSADRSVNQVLVAFDDKLEKLKINVTQEETPNIRYEFNLSDLDLEEVKTNISKRELSIGLATKENEKYIKVLENDEPKDFVSKIELYPSSIENIKLLKFLFTKGISLASE